MSSAMCKDNTKKTKNTPVVVSRQPRFGMHKMQKVTGVGLAGGRGSGRISGEDSARCIPPPLLRPTRSPQSGERPGGATTSIIIRWHDEAWPDLTSTRLDLNKTWSRCLTRRLDLSTMIRLIPLLAGAVAAVSSPLDKVSLFEISSVINSPATRSEKLVILVFSIQWYTMDIIWISEIPNHLLNDKTSSSCSLFHDIFSIVWCGGF